MLSFNEWMDTESIECRVIKKRAHLISNERITSVDIIRFDPLSGTFINSIESFIFNDA